MNQEGGRRDERPGRRPGTQARIASVIVRLPRQWRPQAAIKSAGQPSPRRICGQCVGCVACRIGPARAARSPRAGNVQGNAPQSPASPPPRACARWRIGPIDREDGQPQPRRSPQSPPPRSARQRQGGDRAYKIRQRGGPCALHRPNSRQCRFHPVNCPIGTMRSSKSWPTSERTRVPQKPLCTIDPQEIGPLARAHSSQPAARLVDSVGAAQRQSRRAHRAQRPRRCIESDP